MSYQIFCKKSSYSLFLKIFLEIDNQYFRLNTYYKPWYKLIKGIKHHGPTQILKP